jgi:phosphate transport system permease protein
MSTVAATQASPRAWERMSRSRRAKSRAFTLAMWASGVIAMIPLLLISFYVVRRGVAALNIGFFTHTALPAQVAGGGMKQAIIGTGIIIAIATAIAVPLGLLTGIYLSEYSTGRTGGVVRFVAEILLSTPSIVAGAFIWALVVVALGHFSAFAAGLALTVLMWPIVGRTTEEVLRLIPQELREGALALGVPRWKVVLKIVLPTAGAGIATAIMLGVARGLGETAPVLLTALGNDFVNTNVLKPTDSITLRIFNYAQTPYGSWLALAWGGALILLLSVLALSITARILSVRQQRKTR